MEVHELKTWPEPFEAVWGGEKTAETRRNDRNFQVGDHLALHEYHPEVEAYTGRSVLVKVTHLLKDWQREGYVTMSIRVVGRGRALEEGN